MRNSFNSFSMYNSFCFTFIKEDFMENSEYKICLDEGIFDIQDGKFEDAILKLDKSIELKGDFEISYFYRAVAYQALEKWDEAMLDYTQSIQLNSKMTDAYYNRARIILSRKDIQNPKIENAVADLEIALSLDEKFIDAMYAMAAAKKKLGKYEEAIGFLNRLLEIEPDAINAKALKKLIETKYLNK